MPPPGSVTSPRLLMLPSRVLPPLEFCRGVLPQPGGELTTALEGLRIADTGHQRRGGEGANAFDRHPALRGFALFGQRGDLAVTGKNPFILSAYPVVRTGTGFDADQTWGQRGEDAEDFTSRECFFADGFAVGIDAVKLEHGLGDVETDARSLFHGTSSSWLQPHGCEGVSVPLWGGGVNVVS